MKKKRTAEEKFYHATIRLLEQYPDSDLSQALALAYVHALERALDEALLREAGYEIVPPAWRKGPP